jgi:hypothetical protein
MRHSCRRVVPILCLLAVGPALARAAGTGHPVFIDPAATDPDFPFQGEYVGEIPIDGQPMRIGLQVIARGAGQFDVVAYPGGLPGDGWQAPMKETAKGRRIGEGADADGQGGRGGLVGHEAAGRDQGGPCRGARRGWRRGGGARQGGAVEPDARRGRAGGGDRARGRFRDQWTRSRRC